MEALRRIVRFVWTSATLVGVIGRARRAAAAAAADSEGLLSRFLLKTAAAAVAALGLTVAAVSGVFLLGSRSAGPVGANDEISSAFARPSPLAGQTER